MTTPITTTTQLEAVPVGHVVRSAAGTIAARFDRDRGVVFGDNRPFPWIALDLPVTVLWPLPDPDPSPTVLALAQALATRDGHGRAFTSQTKTESAARIASEYIREAKRIAAHLPGKTEAQVRAEALRDAAEGLEIMRVPRRQGRPSLPTPIATWLRNRADEEAGK